MPSVVLGPLAVRRRVVSNPVEDDFETLLMRSGKEMLKVLTRTKLRVNSAVVDNRVVTTQCTFAGDDTNRLARHDPNDVNAVLTQGG